MGRIGVALAGKVAEIIEDRDVDTARELEREEDAVDQLHRALFAALLAPDNPCPVETAIDVTLPRRYYERFADHAVKVADRLIFLVAGEEQPRRRVPCPVGRRTRGAQPTTLREGFQLSPAGPVPRGFGFLSGSTDTAQRTVKIN